MDTDALCAFLETDVLFRLPALVGCSVEDLRILPAAPHQIRRARWAKKRYSAEVRERFAAAVDGLAKVEDEPDLGILEELASIPNVDSGEAVFAALLIDGKADLFVTGDRRCVQALASAPAEVREGLMGRIVYVEDALVTMTTRSEAVAA